MKPTPWLASLLGATLACAALGTLLSGCSAAHGGPTALPPTQSCTVGKLGPQDPNATAFLGLTEEHARTKAASQRKRVDVIGQNGTCKAAVDLNVSAVRVQIYLEHGKITWSRIG